MYLMRPFHSLASFKQASFISLSPQNGPQTAGPNGDQPLGAMAGTSSTRNKPQILINISRSGILLVDGLLIDACYNWQIQKVHFTLGGQKKTKWKAISWRPNEGEDGHADERVTAKPQELQLRRKSRLRGDPVSANVR